MGLRSAARPKLVIGRLSRWGRFKRRLARGTRTFTRQRVTGRFK